MALTLAQIGELYDDLTFRVRLKGGLLWAASAITAEDVATVNHERRLVLANRITADPLFLVNALIPTVLADSAIAGSTTLTDITALTDDDLKAIIDRALNSYLG